MKTPKLKAEDLVGKYLLNIVDDKNNKFLYHDEAVECAKIDVDNTIEALKVANSMYELLDLLNEYKEVKNELNKML